MPICFQCSRDFPVIKSLIAHFKIQHGLSAGSSIKCVDNDCGRNYATMQTFQRHYSRTHLHAAPILGNEIGQDDLEVDFDQDEEDGVLSEHENPPSPDPNVDDPFENVDIPTFLKEQAAIFSSKLFSHTTMPRNMCQSVIEYANELVSSSAAALQAKVMTALKKEGGPNYADILEVEKCFLAIENPFKGLETDYKRCQYFKKSGLYIEPEPYAIGEHRVIKKINKKRRMVTENLTGQHVPLRKTLKLFFEYEHMFEETVGHIESLSQHTLVQFNIMQGTEWKKTVEHLQSENPDRLYLPLIVYDDDFGAGNPLSPHAGCTKLSGVYATVPCLPPKYQSSLNSIFLCLMFQSAHKKLSTNEALFRPLIEELTYLANEGIVITTPTRSVRTCFILAHLSADNLGLHEICGFVQNFSTSHYPCRICKTRINDIHKQIEEDVDKLRNSINYAEDLALDNVTETGIHEECVWNRVPNFFVLDKVSGDVMHELFHGVACINVVFLFNYLIDVGYITYEMLCLKINEFNYGPIDSRSKPFNMTKNFNRDSIKLSASEMITLVKYIPVILGNYVASNDDVWEWFLIFRDIVDILMAPELQIGCSDLLKVLVKEHHHRYQKLSKSHLVFKHHIMVHYHSFLEKFGPLIKLWCMRFEGKHQKFKMAAAAITSRVNTPKTLSIKHQLVFSYFLHSKTMFRDALQYGPTSQQRLVDLNAFHLEDQVMNLPPQFLMTSWIEVDSLTYKPSMILRYDEDDDIPCFAEILKIFVVDPINPNPNQVYFLCQKLVVIEYVHHYHSYRVKKTNSHLLVSPESLNCPVPLTLSKEEFIVKPYA